MWLLVLLLLFFCKPKTAYEVLKRCVGSEMGIRESTWYVQYLLNRLFALPEKTLSPELLDSLMMEILREEEYTYQTYFQLLTFNQIQLLKAIAKEGIVREVNAAAFIKKYDLKAVSSVNTSLRILIDKEFILRQPDGYIVYDRFMSIWLSRI